MLRMYIFVSLDLVIIYFQFANIFHQSGEAKNDEKTTNGKKEQNDMVTYTLSILVDHLSKISRDSY